MSLTRVVSTVVATLLLPLFLIWALFSRKLRTRLSERLSFGSWNNLQPEESIWIHAASLGELQGVQPFLKELRTRTKLRIVLTTTSLTGLEKAAMLEGVSFAALLPIDHPIFLGRVIRRIRPKSFFVFETEIWPGLLSALHAKNIPAIVVNGRISDRSYPSYRRYSLFIRPFVRNFARCFVQTERDAKRFVRIGFPAAEVIVAGSTKYDISDSSLPVLPSALREQLRIPAGCRLIVGGSVRAGETEILLNALIEIRKTVPNVSMLLAPRHPERFEEEARLIESKGFKLSRRTAPADEADVFLLDSLGELRAAYACGQIAFVGGTLFDIGGHNPMEPAMFGRPMLIGPSTQNVADAVEELIRRGAAIKVSTSGEFAAAAIEFLTSLDSLARAGRAAEEVMRANKGAVKRVLEQIPMEAL